MASLKTEMTEDEEKKHNVLLRKKNKLLGKLKLTEMEECLILGRFAIPKGWRKK